MSNRRLGFFVPLVWLSAIVSVDHLADLNGLIARHHAGLFDPWLSRVNAVLAPVLAVALTIFWWRRRSGSPATDR